ncbi:hypothetical protein ACHHYP_03299 [Achlya hypogyna]|uniref:Uncharacterized protein n=1 Tax=Achlya hypogyna TaxID=1202772 RepID=A0A1V9Z411_ACHHY|nr:hypothetical protein ACHHYP_03299 [Achlya hypogyna]
MGLHYAKRCETVWEKLGVRSVYVAIDVHDATVTWVNSNVSFAIDDIVAATWSPHRHVKLRVQPDAHAMMEFQFQFDSIADLEVFLADVGVNEDSPSVRGSKRRGSFTNRRKSSAGRQSLQL